MAAKKNDTAQVNGTEEQKNRNPTPENTGGQTPPENQLESVKPEDAKPETAPESKNPGPELFSIDELAEKHRLASWKSAALNRMKGWEPGKRVSEAEYAAALAQLANRRIGG